MVSWWDIPVLKMFTMTEYHNVLYIKLYYGWVLAMGPNNNWMFYIGHRGLKNCGDKLVNPATILKVVEI